MILGITGHRWFDVPLGIRERTTQKIIELNPEYIICGMAIGFDQLVATICVELNVPFVAAVPFLGQEKMWPKPVQDHYKELLTKTKEVVVVSEGGYAPWKMFTRNKYILDHSNELLCYYTGKSGGTKDTVEQAIKRKMTIYNIAVT